MSEEEKSVLKGGTQSDVSHKTFTSNISLTICQLQLGSPSPLITEGGREREKEISSVFNAAKEKCHNWPFHPL